MKQAVNTTVFWLLILFFIVSVINSVILTGQSNKDDPNVVERKKFDTNSFDNVGAVNR